MAGKHKQKRQVKDQTNKQLNTLPESNCTEPSTSSFSTIAAVATKRDIRSRKTEKINSQRVSVIRSRSPPANSKSNKKTSKFKDNPKVEKSDILLNSSSIDSDTGSQISKRRRREIRNTSVEQTIESQSISSQPNETIKSRRRRSLLSHIEDNKVVSSDTNMASSSSQRTNTNDSLSQLSNDQPKNSLPSTSRGKRNNTSKNKSKFPQFNMSSGRDPSVFLSNDNAFQGIVSSGMDISHFQNYLSSRSLAATEIGDQINKKLDELHSAAGDRTQEYMLMSEINQHLLVSYEDSLNSLRVSELTTQVVNLIQNCEDNLVDLKNICYNVLLHLMEALPRSSDYLVTSLGMFLNKISNLFDFDSLEQIINVIERISRRHGQAVLQCGAFTIILNYYDFLTAPQQLTILNMVSQCFTNLKPSDFNYIIDGIENLTNRLKQSEPKCVEKVIQCFVRLVSAFQNDEVKLKKLASNNLFVNLQELLISSPPVISDIHEIIQMMAILCTNCSDLAVDLIKQNITQTILCVCNSMTSDSSTISNCNNRSVEEMLSLVNLIAELMPTLPQNEDLFIINRVINPTLFSQSKSLKSISHTEHSWYWFNASSKQWVSHPQNVCQLLEKSLQSCEFEISCQSNGMCIDANLILMQQTHVLNGTKVVSDLKRSRHQFRQSQKNCEVKIDSRLKLLSEQCSRFESSDLSDNVEAVELIRHLFPLLVDIYNEASSYQVRYKCLEAMIRMIYPTTNKTLNNVLNKASLSSLMATLLTSQDPIIIINAIQMGIILKKLPPSLIINFKKEGVLYQLDRMLIYWKEKTCEIVPSNHQSTSYFPSETASQAMTVSAPSGTLDQLSLDAINEIADKPEHYIERFTDNTSTSTTTNTTQRFTNWIMKRSSCIGRPVTTDVTTVQNLAKNRKQRAELEQALDMSIKPISDQQNHNSKRINQIMSMLNLNTSFAYLESKPGFNEKINYENPNKENFCKQWIVKFGGQLNADWKEIGEESVKISSIGNSNGQHQKKDVMYYLKEVVSGLKSENSTLIKKALILYSELLSNDCYISVFEMESSGINEALLDFFTNSNSIESKRDHFITFLDVYMHNHLDHKSSDNKPNFVKKPFVSLVSHLLMCLNQQEQFHVRMFQFPSIQSTNAPNSSSRLTLQSRFNLTQALTEAVLGKMSSRRIENNSRNLDSSIIEAKILPNILLEPSFSRSSNKLTDIECHFAPYPYETHLSDVNNGVEQWNGGEVFVVNNSFNVIMDVLATVSNVEKIVMREIARHRRLTKRFGIMTKESSINDSSDSDDDYDCDAINESLLSGDMDYPDDMSDFADISFHGNSSKKHKTISDKLNSFNLFHINSGHSNTKSTSNKKPRGKQANLAKSIAGASSSCSKSNSNTLSKFRESGLKALANRRSTRQSQHDSESHAVTPSTSSGCSSSLVTSTTSQGTTSKSTDSQSSKFMPETVLKPISKMQILIGDTILPTEMTLYQAIRRYSNHVIQFLANHKEGKTDQELEEAINQVIWKSHHNIHYRPVCATNPSVYTSRQNFKSANSESISTFNFMASLMNSASQNNKPHPHLISTDQFHFDSNISSSHLSFIPSSSSVNTRQRTFHKKIILPQLIQSSLETTDQSNYSQALRHKRRRKNNLETNISIGRNANNSHKILFSNLTKKLPYPALIDYPTIFEAVPNNKSEKINKVMLQEESNATRHSYDLTFTMSQKLETTLALLRCLSAVNRHWHVLSFNLNCNTLIPENEFRSQKLSSKANRQLQDTFSVLARNLPFWCVQLFHACAFLFSVETRQNFFYLFNFDRARTLLYLEGASNQDSDNFLDSTTSEVRRMRVQVNRSERLLDESELLLKNQNDPRVILEISFNNEAGFGLGPTNEFYTQVSTSIMKNDLMLWYVSSESHDEYVLPPPAGLYPRPIYSKNKKLDNKIRNKFVFLGRLMARALLDCRKLDIPLNPVFYKWVLGQEECIHSADLYHIDPILANQLKSLHDLVEKKILIDNDKNISQAHKKEAYEELGVEDLLIVFVHPLYTQIELIKDGANRVVTVHDLSLYLDMVANVTLIEGVRAQMDCVIEGFDSLLPGARMHLSALFESHEIEEIFCGGRVEDNQAWDVKTLTEVCTCDHGYTMNSRSIINLFEIMSDFTKEQRRHFVQFCTGTPRLPVGGFRALRPPFKIVNKKEGGENPDNYLPSVMTCQNFLKLPDYSSKDVMRQRLLYALHEGQNAFFLS